VENLVAYIGDVKISEITPETICNFQQSRLNGRGKKKGVRAATVNRDVATLSVTLTKARKLRIISHNPCVDVQRLEERRERRQAKPLTYGEESRLLQFCPSWLRMLTTLLIETGIRAKKEALPLRWDDIELDGTPAYLAVRSSKTEPASGAFG
jgi:integrase